MLQDETQSQSPLERLTQPAVLPSPPAAQEQRKRMLIALSVLLAALMVVVLRDWDFWFPPSAEIEDTVPPSTRKASTASTAGAVASAPAAAVHDRKPVKTPEKAAEVPLTASTQRTVLPPLQVEVVAGNRHTSVPATSNAIHLDVGAEAPSSPAKTAASGVVSAADRVQLSPQTTQSVRVSVPPDYPLLARQMKVQGAVNLQALISREGTIQELQILSGPSILAAAAREAVRQWRFKPYLQNGQPVETQARITVNFTISTN
jgi:TonB family protein